MRRKKFEELEITDDFIFGKVMQNKELCKQLLETLLGIQIDDITYPESQKIIDITYQGKSVRLDAYVEDEEQRVYNAEMQRGTSPEEREKLPKRSRYYQGMIDLNLIEKGAAYTDLKQSYVIFICTFDPFGQGRYCYTFRNLCMEDKDFVLQDGAARIFFNTKGNMENASEKVKNLLRYMETKRVTDDFTRTLDEEVENVKRNEKWRREYMKTYMHDLEMKWQGKAEGKAEFLVELLSEFGEVPEKVRTSIMAESNLETLTKWLKIAAKADSIQGFEEKAGISF